MGISVTRFGEIVPFSLYLKRFRRLCECLFVTRCGEILPFCPYFKMFRRLCECLFRVGQKFEPALVNILCHGNLAIWSH